MAEKIDYGAVGPGLPIEVVRHDDVLIARHLARQVSAQIGFDETECEEIVIVVSELASNLIKHAKAGKIVLKQVGDGARTGLQIDSYDTGPGITDVERALTDGYSTAGGIGTGLGTVNRLMDGLDIESHPGKGTHVMCVRWRRAAAAVTACPLEFGVATCSHPAMQVNGDAFVIRRWDHHALAGVIDGLGHGQFAHRASETARQYVETHWDQPLDAIFRGVARACRATRGVVMALASFDFGHGACPPPPGDSDVHTCIRLAFASIGNVEARVYGNLEPTSFIVRRGILGGSAPMPVVTHHTWAPPNVLVLHSDGLATHWRWGDFPGLMEMPATDAAALLLRSLQKDDDDATVIVVKRAEDTVH